MILGYDFFEKPWVLFALDDPTRDGALVSFSVVPESTYKSILRDLKESKGSYCPNRMFAPGPICTLATSGTSEHPDYCYKEVADQGRPVILFEGISNCHRAEDALNHSYNAVPVRVEGWVMKDAWEDCRQNDSVEFGEQQRPYQRALAGAVQAFCQRVAPESPRSR